MRNFPDKLITKTKRFKLLSINHKQALLCKTNPTKTTHKLLKFIFLNRHKRKQEMLH